MINKSKKINNQKLITIKTIKSRLIFPDKEHGKEVNIFGKRKKKLHFYSNFKSSFFQVEYFNPVKIPELFLRVFRRDNFEPESHFGLIFQTVLENQTVRCKQFLFQDFIIFLYSDK